MPTGVPFVQPFKLGDMLVAKDVVETASSIGDGAAGGPFEGGDEGFKSGDGRKGSEGVGEGAFGLSFGLSPSLLRVC